MQSVSNNDKIIYTYSADGVRLKKTAYNSDGSIQRSWDYIGPFVYEDNVISYIATAEGRARYNGSSYSSSATSQNKERTGANLRASMRAR